MWKRLRRFAVLLLAGAVGFAGPPQPTARQASEPEPDPLLLGVLPTPTDFYSIALADALTLPANSVKFIRYVSCREEQELSVKTTSWTFGFISRFSEIIRPRTIAGGLLVRVDLRAYAFKDSDLFEMVGLWEGLAFCPDYSDIITRDTLDFLQEDAETAGNKEAAVQLQNFKDAKVDAIRFNARHIPKDIVARLQSLLGTQAPVVDHLYLKHRLLTTIKGKAVYQVVFGGRYYEFRGIKKAKDVLGNDTKVTDLDLFFENLGVGNIKGGLSADQLFNNLGSDQRALVVHSNITGKPRDVLSFHTPKAKIVSSWGAITGDVKDDEIDIGDRSFANLAKPRQAAREAIFPGANGFPIYALFDGKGALQDEVPFDIANDHTIPRPHTKRLQAARGCIICHCIEGHNGWMPVVNDGPQLLKWINVFDDRGNGRGRIIPDEIRRIAGQYLGNFSKDIRRVREDMAEVTLKATGPWPNGGDQTDAAKFAAVRLQKELDDYIYTFVTVKQALKEEGWIVPENKAQEVFNNLHPPDIRSAVNGVVPEDSRIALLKSGIAIPRMDWGLVYSYAMERSLRSPFRQVLLKAAKTLNPERKKTR